MTGEDPGDLFVDHINRDPSDNRWANLRLATRSQNGANSVRREKPHGRGVYLCRKKGYPDRLLVYCGSEYQGNYPTSQLKEAQELFEKRYKEKFGEFAVSL